MATTRLLDFSDIVTAVCNELKIPLTDTHTVDKVKYDIAMVYEQEVVPFKRWMWLSGHVRQIHKAFYGTGTASVTPSSTAVTLSVTPNISEGSFAGKLFAVEGFQEVYEIATHTAGSTAVVLTSSFQGTLNAAANYKIWTDQITLPIDCREVVEAYHQRNPRNMEGRGFQDFRQIVNLQPKASGFPCYFNVQEFAGTNESDRYRIMRVHPAVTSEPVTINLDYVKEIAPLVDDGDEPLMPVEDRIVLVYGALARGWDRERNPEAAAKNDALFTRKLSRMAGKMEEGIDRPKLVVDSRYLANKRGSRLRGTRSRGLDGAGGGSSYSIPSYLEGATINGANLTGNVTASPGITVDGRDLSVDGAALDAHIAASDNVHGIGVGSDVVGTNTAQTVIEKTIDTTTNHILGTLAKVAVYNDTTGDLESSPTDATAMAFLTDSSGLAAIGMNDNQVVAANLFSYPKTFGGGVFFYSIVRGASIIETGLISISTDGTSVSFVPFGSSVGISGVTLSAVISGSNVQVKYTSTSTGSAPNFRYKAIKWVT